jgi:uncharacterized membrane protein YcaP (DUF421 family)
VFFIQKKDMDLSDVFGTGDDLSSLQMGCRALVLYLIMVVLLRISGMRTFGGKSTFDNIIAIMLGAVLSRAVVGASPFVPTVSAGLILVLCHRLLGWMSIYIKGLGRYIKGEETVLYKDGQIKSQNLKRCLLTNGDLMESVRLTANLNSLEKVEQITMERSGRISVVLRD